MAEREPTIEMILRRVAAAAEGPLDEQTIIDRTLALRPSAAKSARRLVLDRLRTERYATDWVPLGGTTYTPTHIVAHGLQFRVVLEAADLRAGGVQTSELMPFLPLADGETVMVTNSQGHVVAANVVRTAAGTRLLFPGLVARLAAGDSLLVTIESSKPPQISIAAEPAAQLRVAEADSVDRAFADEIVRLVRNEDARMKRVRVVLEVFAAATWRTGYPGRPWRAVLLADPRIDLLPDDLLYATAVVDPAPLEVRRAIADLQGAMRTSRIAAAHEQLWDGVAPRASAARTIFNAATGETTIIRFDPIDTLVDHTPTIEELAAGHEYRAQGWFDEDDFFGDDGDFGMLLDDDDDDDDDEFGDIAAIDDLDAFLAERPALAAATRKLMDALPPEDNDRLQLAATLEDAQAILARHYHRSLPENPALFALLVPYTLPDTLTNPDTVVEPDEDWDEAPDLADVAFVGDFDPEEHDADPLLNQSLMLIEAFYEELRAQGRSKTTADARAEDLTLYAEFLATFYRRDLLAGDYATLDELLFFFYPRRVLTATPRTAREICTSIKQFYAFARERHGVRDAFAQAIWKRREQAAQLVDLYDQIDPDAPEFELLFAHLFAPYTA